MLLTLIRRTFAERNASAWHPWQRRLHWLVVVLLASQIPTSWAIDRSHVAHVFNLEQDPLDLFLHQVHIWVGIFIAFIALARVILRLVHGAPPAGAVRHPALAILAGTTHAGLYLLLGLSPVMGFLAAYIDGRFGPIHVALNWTLLALVVLHVGAALWHHLALKDDVLKKMLGR